MIIGLINNIVITFLRTWLTATVTPGLAQRRAAADGLIDHYLQWVRTTTSDVVRVTVLAPSVYTTVSWNRQ